MTIWLQIAPLLIIFVDILPEMRAVPFAEFFLLAMLLLLKSGFEVLSKLSACVNLPLIGKEQLEQLYYEQWQPKFG